MTTQTSKVAIVTGASRGIGAVIAKQLAKQGFAVAINYASSATEASRLVVELRQDGHQAIAIKADVANADDVRRLFDETEAQLGKVDVLVNNAGILKVLPLAQHTDELFDQTFNIHARGTFNTLREAATRLNTGGRIINFSSSTVGMNLPGYAVYIASKAAVESLTQVFAKEMRGRNITVNAVAPGPGGDRPVPARQERRADPDLRQDGPAGTSGSARRHRSRCVFPGRPGLGLGQRANPARQRWAGLTMLKLIPR
jgi:Dehydrogenases with different specificities (related to short-chain alcohol dehydrogenases)